MAKKSRRRTLDRKRSTMVDMAPRKAGSAKGGAQQALGGPDTSKPRQLDALALSWGVAPTR